MRQMSPAADRALVVRQALRRQDRAGRGWQGVFILDLATAIAELCEHLTATKTRYPGTDLILRYEVKTRP